MDTNIEQYLHQFGYIKDDDLSIQIDLPNKQNILECPKCSKYTLYSSDGVIQCRECNTEFGNVIDDTAEWRNYGSEDNRSSDPSRCGASIHPILVESSYGTTLGYSKNMAFGRLRKLNNWHAVPYHERSLKQVFDKLTRDAHTSGLTPNIIEFSHVLFAEACKAQSNFGETKLSRGDPREALIAACLFYSCKEYEVPRSPQEIAKMSDISSNDVNRGINLFYELMKNSKLIDINKHISKYSDFIDRYCNNLGLDTNITNEIMIFAHKVDQKKLLTKNTPQAMACACIFFISNMLQLRLTKNQIAEKCGISIPTITKSYEKLLPHTKELI